MSTDDEAKRTVSALLIILFVVSLFLAIIVSFLQCVIFKNGTCFENTGVTNEETKERFENT